MQGTNKYKGTKKSINMALNIKIILKKYDPQNCAGTYVLRISSIHQNQINHKAFLFARFF